MCGWLRSVSTPPAPPKGHRTRLLDAEEWGPHAYLNHMLKGLENNDRLQDLTGRAEWNQRGIGR